MGKVVCPWDTLINFVTDAFVGYGIPREDAEICTDILLESDRRGIESHGCNRFKPIYLDRIKAGIQKPVTEFEIVKETPCTAVVDGHDGMGQVIGYKSMQMAIDKAKKYGMGMVAVRNSCHYGIAGYYATMATKQGCIGITGTNARPSVAPTFGVEGMFGTNPLTIGIPTDEDFDFVIDCATSITQNGKIEYYERIGEDVHPGTIIGKDGKEISGDAGEALKKIRSGDAALTTLGGIGEALGGYKGYGYAMVIELHFLLFCKTVITAKHSTVRMKTEILFLIISAISLLLLILAILSVRMKQGRKQAKLSARFVTRKKHRDVTEFTQPVKRNGIFGSSVRTAVFRLTNLFKKR